MKRRPARAFINCTVFVVALVMTSVTLVAADTKPVTVSTFVAEHCARCHNAQKMEGEFRIDALSSDLTNGLDARKWAEVLEKITAGEMPPKNQAQPTREEADQVIELLANSLHEAEVARLAKREPVSMNKLTRDEYVNTVRDLLGVTFDAADPTGISEDDAWLGFTRVGSMLSLSPSHVEKYLNAADTILAEAYPEKPAVKFFKHKDAIELRGNVEDRKQPWASRARVDMWPGHQLQGGRPGPGQALPISGNYRVRIQLSGLKPKRGPAPHLAIYATDLDRMLFEQDILAPEAKPTIVEFTTHLPAGHINLSLTNSAPGPSTLPRSGRADPRIPFFSLAEGRRPWQLKLTDEEGAPLYPFLIVDWIEWEGPIVSDEAATAQRTVMPDDRSGARNALTKFTEQAFRRPVNDQEIERLLKLIDSEMEGGESFESAYKAALHAVLCSTSFLYIVEGSPLRADTRLNDWELATRLSYFLWSSMPDAELRQAARDGSLHLPENLRMQVRRMLADPRSQRFSQRFPFEWLQLNKVGMFAPDKKLYPNYDDWLESSMIAETTAFFGEVLQKNLSLREFIDSDWTILNSRLSDHYQLPDVAPDGLHRVSLDATSHRGGILTQAAVLSLTSDGTRHRPVHRGKWVLESILGRSPPPPPANVPAIEPAPPTEAKTTLRNKLDAHKSNESCAGCHRRIDPLGFAFDNYDAIGRWREEEAVGDGSGANPKVDASGTLPDGRAFRDAQEFKQLLLADLNTFNRAFIEKLATYATRRVMTYDDRRQLQELALQSQASEYRLQNIVELLILSDLFQKR